MLEWFEAGVVAAAVGVAGRVLLKRPVRREMETHPILLAFLFVGLVAIIAGLVWVATRANWFQHLVVGVIGTAVVASWWRARPRFGRSRGLPPGSLGVAESFDAVDDPDFYLRSAERWGSIFKMAQVHQPVVCIADAAVGLDLIEQHIDALIQVEWPFNRLFPGGYFEFMNGDLHDRYREMIAPALGSEVLADSMPSIIQSIRSHLAEMARRAADGPIDPEPLLYPMTFPALVRVVLGIPIDDPRTTSLRSAFDELNRFYELFLPTPGRMAAAYARAAAVVEALLRAAAAAGPAPVGTRSVLSQVVAADPSRAADPILIGNLVMMVKDGSTIVRGQLRWVLKAMADDPGWADRLVEGVATTPGDLAHINVQATSLVHETLRLYGTPYIYRRLARDLKVGPYRLPKGWMVRLCFDPAHTNPHRYPEPKRFDPDRFVAGCPEAIDYCPFGHGTHACIGADLTLAIATTLARELALGYDVRTATDGPPWRINRHWGIWRPSAVFRVAMAARTRSGVAGSSSIQTPQAS